ncbi:DUF4037 domain-containing protein [Microbacterium sp. CFBP9034]|uniref:DUF4037 domain-containing protein n=1 Tax=Microbacterium sp. CFBP9034 TaxID=3096540 RepID=UPI002A6A72F7|nr:DUF4037 domain-containing protein [Microbacterium sp. CFBP9034]MDY0910882.1 DUF4037 domain-containing protein [Microbacterium sp. CFBP9034]
MTDTETSGAGLARAYFLEIVEPLLTERFPGLRYSAGRLGPGSDVLGLDDAMSRDHDWGLRLSLFVPTDAVTEVDRELGRTLPESFRGLPVRFAFTGETEQRHHVGVTSVSEFLHTRIGFDPRSGASARDWLSLSGQAALEVVAGPVFVDSSGELDAARRALEWYPDDVWRYVLACDWIRIEQELPLMGRAADVGDDVGSRLIAARLAHSVMHLAFMVERRWPPYSKWFGTVFQTLASAPEVGAAVDATLRSADLAGRQRGVAVALDAILQRQNALGLTATTRATIPFWDRPYLHPDPAIVAELLNSVADPSVRLLPRGRGSVEQRTDNVDVLIDVDARKAAVAD